MVRRIEILSQVNGCENSEVLVAPQSDVGDLIQEMDLDVDNRSKCKDLRSISNQDL